MQPICNYEYYEHFNYTYDNYDHQDYIYLEFEGLGGKYDGSDNYFTVTASPEVDYPGFSTTDDVAPSQMVPFCFSDGTQGQRETKIWKDAFKYIKEPTMYYESNIYDIEKKYCLMLAMLEDEYNANEQDITKFVESACFRTSDLGISKEEDIIFGRRMWWG
ncbi:MAG: hypothetical protein K2N63_15025 [Lachnospiraceae bacterium]|nr:hypothetical protein [Lachnospiraceae bacterium]